MVPDSAPPIREIQAIGRDAAGRVRCRAKRMRKQNCRKRTGNDGPARISSGSRRYSSLPARRRAQGSHIAKSRWASCRLSQVDVEIGRRGVRVGAGYRGGQGAVES